MGRKDWGLCSLTLERGHTDAVLSAAFSPDGSRLVTASRDRTVKIWDAKTGTEVLTLTGHSGEVNSASFSPDGSRVITGSGDVYSKALGSCQVLHRGNQTLGGAISSPLWSASFSPDGARVVTASREPEWQEFGTRRRGPSSSQMWAQGAFR